MKCVDHPWIWTSDYRGREGNEPLGTYVQDYKHVYGVVVNE